MTQPHRLLLKWARTLHVYLTLFGFVLLLFFAVTGFMLNHEDWFLPGQRTTGTMPTELIAVPDNRDAIIDKLRDEFDVRGDLDSFTFDQAAKTYRITFKDERGTAEAVIRQEGGATEVTHEAGSTRARITIMEGKMPKELLVPGDESKKLPIVERLRKDYAIKGEADFKYEKESESFRVVFKAPGYRAEAVIQGTDGQTKVTHTTSGIAGLFLDLHRGKDSGLPWSFVIDGVSVLFVLVSITGLVLWSSLRGRAQHGVAVLAAGLAFGLVVYFLWVPR
jgi:hypothetical protein